MAKAGDLIPAREAESQQQISALLSWERLATRAYSDNTRRAWRADWKLFLSFCQQCGATSLPADPLTVREYVLDRIRAGKKPATIRRYLATVTRAHQAIEVIDPCESEPVRLALQEMKLTTTARQKQARAFGRQEIAEFLKSAGEGLPADRARAILCVAYDTMARRSELVALDVADISIALDGSGSALIRCSKTDQQGEGASSYLSKETIHFLKIWLEGAGIVEGALFRRLWGTTQVGERLGASAIASLYKSVARWVGWSARHVNEVSGHSIRVGATQDLLSLNIDLASVMQAGRWKSTAMPMRYGENIIAARGGMARAAQIQGRNTADSASNPELEASANQE
jgi:site-specific recombinase XerD